MRTFKRANVIKQTDNESKIQKYLELGYKELTSQPKEKGEAPKEPDYEDMELSELKKLADERGIEYAKNASTEKMVDLLKGE
ncbi:hypothetical protein CHCC20442_4314 [Bacillus licheniformis]|uniref:hypothetical protein n=1 Tax=Bacillus licheniformis TaxID=1402 RepID=UPI0011A06C56|nr:hypothetical protein [Bacillus licheniformis]TWK08601.1 hypothetical protein CHCC20442_4314 [Bacillus licheniformis]